MLGQNTPHAQPTGEKVYLAHSSEVSVHDQWAPKVEQHTEGKPLTSWHLKIQKFLPSSDGETETSMLMWYKISRERPREKKGPETKHGLQKYSPSDLLLPNGPHLIIQSAINVNEPAP